MTFISTMRNILPNKEFIQHRKRDGRITIGIIIALLGVVMLLRTFGLMPGLRAFGAHAWAWAFVAAGAFSLFHSRFRNPAGYALLLIGGSHIVDRFEIANGVYSDQLVWPLGIIIFGLALIFRKRSRRATQPMKSPDACESISDTSRLDMSVTFGGRKEIVTAKNFQGGRMAATFAGIELNLMQADAASGDPMILTMNVLFAGCEIIVPAHWEIQNEIAPTFGAVEDNRGYRASSALPAEGGRRLLVLKGYCTCGSIEIKAY